MITLHYNIIKSDNQMIVYFWKEDKAGETFQDAECDSLFNTDPSYDALEAYADFVIQKFVERTCHKINMTNDTINV